VKGQPRNGFGENADTGVDCRRLHGSSLVDCLARRSLPKQKGQATEMIRRLVPRTKEFAE